MRPAADLAYGVPPAALTVPDLAALHASAPALSADKVNSSSRSVTISRSLRLYRVPLTTFTSAIASREIASSADQYAARSVGSGSPAEMTGVSPGLWGVAG